MQFSYTRVYADEAGESHFAPVPVAQHPFDYAPPAPPLLISDTWEATRCLLLTGEAGWDGIWHPSPVRQFMVPISGSFEVETSDGERRRFRRGEVLLLDDLGGRGHYTRVVPDADATVFVVHLA